MSPRRRGEIGFLSLVAILFFNVSGGPYGLEDAVSTLGPGLVLVLLVVTPLVWSLPVSLAMAELAAALPEEGGYVVWVERHRSKIGERDEHVSFPLRVTIIFRLEDDDWKIVHRHTDTVTSPRPHESMIKE